MISAFFCGISTLSMQEHYCVKFQSKLNEQYLIGQGTRLRVKGGTEVVMEVLGDRGRWSTRKFYAEALFSLKVIY